MNTEIVIFNTKDQCLLNGIIYKSGADTKKILIQIHGMTSNCFKARNQIIANEIANISIDTIDFNNRGSDIIRYVNIGETKKLAGTAYEDIEDCYYDIVGAMEYAINLGYEEIYLQGHSLGCTKVIYTYQKLLSEKSYLLDKIKGIILLSLVDIPGIVRRGTKQEFITLAEEKEQEGKMLEMMPLESFIHPISVKNYLKYVKYNKNIDFAKYDELENEFKELNDIQCPLFMRWGNVNEMIKQNAKDLSEFLNSKIKNKTKDISYIDGANHGYYDKENILANEIKNFLEQI